MPETVPAATTTTARTKIGVVGAGSVGSSLAYAALIRGTAQEVALYDVAGDRVRAEGLDLAHGAMFTPSSRVTGSDDVAVLAGADIVFVTAGARVAEAVLRDEHAVLPVSTVLEDYHGVSGVALSVPSIVARRGVVERLEVPMDAQELAMLHRSAEAIRATLATIGY